MDVNKKTVPTEAGPGVVQGGGGQRLFSGGYFAEPAGYSGRSGLSFGRGY